MLIVVRGLNLTVRRPRCGDVVVCEDEVGSGIEVSRSEAIVSNADRLDDCSRH